jgi:hypothetical protein
LTYLAKCGTLDDNEILRLSTSAPEPAAVVGRIPIGASYAGIDCVSVHLLVHVVDGYLDEFEVYREDSSKVRCPPSDRESIDFDAC